MTKNAKKKKMMTIVNPQNQEDQQTSRKINASTIPTDAICKVLQTCDKKKSTRENREQ